MSFALHHQSSHDRKPAPAWGMASAMTSLSGAVLSWPARVIDHRRLMNQMAQMNDHELRDIGLSRQDILDATAVPRAEDPGALLAARAAERRQPRG